MAEYNIYDKLKPWDEYTKEEQDLIDANEAHMSALVEQAHAKNDAEDLRCGTVSDFHFPWRSQKRTMMFLMEQRNKSFAYRAKQAIKKVILK